MEAARVPAPDADVEIVECPTPEPGPEQVRIAVDACGVCGGDGVVREGAPPIDYPRIPGHEIAGRIDAVGADVTGHEPGERVAVGWHGGHCFACEPCRRGAFTACERERITGVHRDGGYAEFAVTDREAVIPVPDGIDATAAGPLACAGLTAFNALRNSDARPGDLVAIAGIGGVGHLGVQFARAFGFEVVALSRGPDKRAPARELGADHYVDTEREDPAAALDGMGGADAVLATAPARGAIEPLVGGLAPEGELLAVGVPDEPVRVPLGGVVDGRQSLRGWSSGHARDAQDALEFAALRGIEPAVETYPLEAAGEAYDAMDEGEVRFRAVLEP